MEFGSDVMLSAASEPVQLGGSVFCGDTDPPYNPRNSRV